MPFPPSPGIRFTSEDLPGLAPGVVMYFPADARVVEITPEASAVFHRYHHGIPTEVSFFWYSARAGASFIRHPWDRCFALESRSVLRQTALLSGKVSPLQFDAHAGIPGACFALDVRRAAALLVCLGHDGSVNRLPAHVLVDAIPIPL